MAAKGQSIVTTYYAWNTSTNVYQTGDAGNHTLRLLKDGTEAAPTNAATEVDSTNVPGLYALALTSAEATFNTVDVAGKSSTSNVVLIGKTYLFDNVPVAAPNSNNGLITVGSGAGQISMASGFAFSNLQQWIGLPPAALQSVGSLVAVAVISGAVSSVNGPVNGNINGSVNNVLSTVSANVITLQGVTVQQASGFIQANLVQWEGVAPAPLTAGLLVQASASGSATANITQVLGVAVAANSGFLQTNTVQVVGVAPTIEADGRLTVAVVSGLVNSNITLINGVATVTSSAQIGVNVVSFAGNPQGVTNIDRSTRSIALATTSNGSTTTTITLSTIAPANLTPSQYVGRIVNFDANTTTANLRGQSTNITASVTSSGGALSVTALTDAPVFGDTFSIT